MPGISANWAELDGELLAARGVAWEEPRSTRVGESDGEESDFKESSPMSRAVGCSSPVGTDCCPEDLLLEGIFSLEVDLPFSSGLGGVLGTIERFARLSTVRRKTARNRVLMGEVSLSRVFESIQRHACGFEIFSPDRIPLLRLAHDLTSRRFVCLRPRVWKRR